MRRESFVLKIFVRPEIFIYAAFLVFTTAFFVLSSLVQNSGPASLQGGQDILKHYVNLNAARIIWTAILFVLALFVHGFVLWCKAVIQHIDPITLLTRQNVVRFIRGARSVLKNSVFFGIPFALTFYSMSMALGPLNVFNATRLRDELLFTWDTFLTGTFPPLSLASFQYPGWFVNAVDFSFFYLVPVLTIFGAYLLIARPRLFREAAGAFFLGLMILFFGWFAFPVLSPHDRFIDNVYELPTVEAIQPYLEEYRPQQEIASFLEGMRESKEGLSVLPTSTFPSAHVAWAVVLVYYAWRLWPWLGLAIFPFALLSAIGTFFFAQHYFVDFPAGVLVSMASIFVAQWFVKQQEKFNRPAVVSQI